MSFINIQGHFRCFLEANMALRGNCMFKFEKLIFNYKIEN